MNLIPAENDAKTKGPGHYTVDVDPNIRRIINSEITLTVIMGPYNCRLLNRTNLNAE